LKNEPSGSDLVEQSNTASHFKYRPLISAIVPIYKLPPDVLEETIKCLEVQTYDNWEACLVWSDTDDLLGWQWLKDRCAGDSRFKCKLLKENGGISRNSNAAFELATGEYVALLDHDDVLAAWAFYETVKLLQTKPELDLIYSDKDSVSADGTQRLNALFKPEWSPEILHSVNYLTHLNVIRSRLITQIGGWRPETDGAQDWDLFFRITEVTKAIERIPSVLYHWRILPSSTATGIAAKPYAALGQLRAQQESFMRRKIPASVIPSSEGMFKVNWPIRELSSHLVLMQSGTLGQLQVAVEALTRVNHKSISRLDVLCANPPSQTLLQLKNKFAVDVTFVHQPIVDWRSALAMLENRSTAESLILLDGKSVEFSATIVEELSGWASMHEAGRVVGNGGESAPLFAGEPLYSYGLFGGPLWYRNTRACSPLAVAISTKEIFSLRDGQIVGANTEDSFAHFCMSLTSRGKRGVINPFARIQFLTPPEANWQNDGVRYHQDPYFSPVFDSVSPLRLKK
jgi:O-antigen biosynthesis protein